MNQSQTVDLQVKLALEYNGESTIKRISTAQTFKELLTHVDQVCKNAGVPQQQKRNVCYRDFDNDKIDVSDDYELQMAYATALSADNKVKFHIELPGYVFQRDESFEIPATAQAAKVMQEKIEEQQKVPEIVVPKQEEKPVAQQQPIVPEIIEESKDEPVNLVSEEPVIEAEIGDDSEHPQHSHGHGKKGKKGKGKKGKCGGGAGNMPRKAIKNLIRQELENAVPGIFDKLMSQADTDQNNAEEQIEESKEDLVRHEGIECDGCGVCPIVGIRYKCSVRKDFDYCAKCEETLESDYPFLKIRKAGGAPSMIMVVLNEEGKDEKPSKPQWQEMRQAWKQAKEQYGFGHCGPHGRHRHGPCGKPANEWTQEEIEEKTKCWKGMVGGFLNKMGMNKDQWKDMKKEGGCNWEQMKQMKKEWKGDYKQKRAEIISNPDVVLECKPGQVVLHDIEVKNNTHWGWKKGVFLGMDDSVEIAGMPIEVINMPIDNKLEAMETLKLQVPITVVDDAIPCDNVFEFKLRFRGPKGGEIGHPIPMKVKVVPHSVKDEPQQEEPKKQEPKSHLELVKLAVKLFDTDKLGQTFNECLEVVTLVNGDEEVAKKSLQPRQ